MYAVEGAPPVFVARGLTTTRTLSIVSGVTSQTVTGTYALYDRDGTQQATGSVSSGSVSITPPSDMLIGSGGYEVWTLTSPAVMTIRQAVYVTTAFDSGRLLVTSSTIAAWYPYLATMYPSGSTSWELLIVGAQARTLRDLIAMSRLAEPGQALDIWDGGVLAMPVIHATLAQVMAYGFSLTGAASLAVLRDGHEEAYRDAMRRVALAWSTDGDGVAELGPDRMPATGFPAPGPAAGGGF